MKAMNYAALGLSAVALAVALWTWQQAEERAEQALQRREKALVEKYKPDVAKVCKEFGLKEQLQDPQTLDELLRPLGALVVGLSR